MLKGAQFINTVKHDQNLSSQINHAVKSHHPQALQGSMY